MSSQRKILSGAAHCFSLLRSGASIVQNGTREQIPRIQLHSFQWIYKRQIIGQLDIQMFQVGLFPGAFCDRVTKGSEANLSFICHFFWFH